MLWRSDDRKDRCERRSGVVNYALDPVQIEERGLGGGDIRAGFTFPRTHRRVADDNHVAKWEGSYRLVALGDHVKNTTDSTSWRTLWSRHDRPAVGALEVNLHEGVGRDVLRQNVSSARNAFQILTI